MTLYVNTFFEKRLAQLLDLAARIEAAFTAADLEYRVTGGLATYLYVESAEPDAGRLTCDIDIVVRREAAATIARTVEPFGLQYVPHADILVQPTHPSTSRAVHLIFTDDQLPGASPRLQGIPVIPLADLIRLKLTAFRIKDQMHLKDMDEARLITPEIESQLSEPLLARLAQVRAND